MPPPQPSSLLSRGDARQHADLPPNRRQQLVTVGLQEKMSALKHLHREAAARLFAPGVNLVLRHAAVGTPAEDGNRTDQRVVGTVIVGLESRQVGPETR